MKPGDAITYTVTAENTGNVDLTPILLTDDLSKVLDDATIIDGTLAASFGDAPTISGTTLTWSGDLAVGESVTLTYAVKGKADVTADAKLVNVVVGSGSANCDEQGNCTEVPSNCPAGSTSADCTTTHTTDVPAPPKPGLPATGTREMWSAGIAAMIVLAVGAGLLTIRRRQTS